MAELRLEHRYDAPPDLVWAAAIDFDLLAQSARGLTTFRGLPQGQVRAGQVVNVDVSLFGLLPWQPYQMQLLDFDPIARQFHSSEKGIGVATWEHRLRVAADGDQSVLIDHLEIEAENSKMTWAYIRWARYLYRRRHKPRQAWIKANLT